MEDRINQGYRLFVEHNPEKQELVGVYMKATGGATTKIRTGKQIAIPSPIQKPHKAYGF